MSYLVLEYSLVSDYLERRGEYRDEHLRLAREALERGDLALAGALGDPTDRALLVFSTQDRAAVEAFAADDPYVRAGLVTSWTVRPWTIAVGGSGTR